MQAYLVPYVGRVGVKAIAVAALLQDEKVLNVSGSESFKFSSPQINGLSTSTGALPRGRRAR